MLLQDSCNIFVNLSTGEWKQSRRIIVDIILGTDMVNHFDQISKTQVLGIDTVSALPPVQYGLSFLL